MIIPRLRSFRSRDLAAAVAAAWCTRRRGGQVVVEWEPGDPQGLEAWARRQDLPLEFVSVVADPEEPLQDPVPVEVSALPRNGLPPWPSTDDPDAQWEAVRAWLTDHGGPWVEILTWTPEPAMCRIAAALPGEGCRVVWRMPRGARLDPAWLSSVADARIPLKIVAEAADLPTAHPAGWWVVVSGDPARWSAALAQHLRDEMPLLLGIGPAQPVTWPRDQAWEPGQGAVARG